MCKYCEITELHNAEPIEAEWIEIKVIGNTLNLDYSAYSCDSSFEEAVKINFCPICGKELVELPAIEEEEEEEEEEDE
ncbi:hypothetical protein BigBertha_223 [Bacillus phage BigBertha]|uniref:Uncharacterized protein n=1 Tax=Bacillus phage BigBertha TaxID=1406781 RepID=U5PSM3_9CAUD|nr:hypothetical protein BigBertha_223 [Bacillus phage BigBertha]AGY46731.1 hypothetical protein BigBertha_223 [Bacillus phage BigBertha]